MEQQYNLGGDIVSVGGGGIEDMVRDTIGFHYNIAFAAIIILVIVVIYLIYKSKSQSFVPMNPTQMMRYTTTNFGGTEALGAASTMPAMQIASNGSGLTNRSMSSFSQLTEDDTAPPSDWYLPGGTTLTTDAVGYCGGANPPAQDANAWGWMYSTLTGGPASPAGVAATVPEGFKGGQAPKGKNLMAVMNGY